MFTDDVDSDNEDFNQADIHLEIDTNSIDTNNSERDTHLKLPLFLDTQKFSKITITGSIQKSGDDDVLAGEIIILETKKASL